MTGEIVVRSKMSDPNHEMYSGYQVWEWVWKYPDGSIFMKSCCHLSSVEAAVEHAEKMLEKAGKDMPIRIAPP